MSSNAFASTRGGFFFCFARAVIVEFHLPRIWPPRPAGPTLETRWFGSTLLPKMLLTRGPTLDQDIRCLLFLCVAADNR